MTPIDLLFIHDVKSIVSDEPVRKADDSLVVVVVVVVVLHRRHGRLVVDASRRVAVRVSAEQHKHTASRHDDVTHDACIV